VSIRALVGASGGLSGRLITGEGIGERPAATRLSPPLDSPDIFDTSKRFNRVVALLIAARIVRVFSVHSIGNNLEAAMV
jgi:hypothetical protein